jgi:hypothetical protein
MLLADCILVLVKTRRQSYNLLNITSKGSNNNHLNGINGNGKHMNFLFYLFFQFIFPSLFKHILKYTHDNFLAFVLASRRMKKKIG